MASQQNEALHRTDVTASEARQSSASSRLVLHAENPDGTSICGIVCSPGIAGLFHRKGYIENIGTGITLMQNLMAEAQIDPILFEFTDFVTAVFKRPITEVSPGPSEKTRVKPREKTWEKILALMAANPTINMDQLAETIGITTKGIE